MFNVCFVSRRTGWNAFDIFEINLLNELYERRIHEDIAIFRCANTAIVKLGEEYKFRVHLKKFVHSEL